MEKQERMAKARDIFEKFGETVQTLYERWQDEKEYEDFNEYSKFMKAKIEDLGGNFIKATKRPFGCVFSLDIAKYQVNVSSKSYGYKRIA